MPTSAAPAAPVVRAVWSDELRVMLKLAWPVVLTQVATIALNTVDVIMIGWLGPEELAAATLATSMVFPLTFFSIGLLAVTAAMFAHEIGAIRLRGVRRTLRQGFWVAITLFVPIAAILWHGDALMRLTGQDPKLVGMAADYLRYVTWGMLPLLCFNVLRNFVTAHSRPRSAMVVMIGGVFLNAALDYVLIFGKLGFPALGIIGGAIATVAVQWAMLLALAGFLLTDRRFRRYNLFGRFWRPDWPRYREILLVGLPIGLTVLAEASLFAVSAFMVGTFGPAQLAGHAVAIQCASVAFMVPHGVGQAGTVRVGLAIGRHRPEDAVTAGRAAMAIGLGFAAVAGLVFWFFDRALVGLYLPLGDLRNAEAIGFAVAYLHVAAIFQLVDAGQTIAAGNLRGLKDTRVPAVLAFLCYWGLGFPAGALLAFHGGLDGVGVWSGLAVGLAAACLALTWRFERQVLRVV